MKFTELLKNEINWVSICISELSQLPTSALPTLHCIRLLRAAAKRQMNIHIGDYIAIGRGVKYCNQRVCVFVVMNWS